MPDAPRAFGLTSTFVHLGLGSLATPLPDFAWTPEYLEAYEERTAADGPEGRLVTVSSHSADWTSWERHPAGEELVAVLSGRVVVIQDLEGSENRVELGPLEGVINPRGVWHTADVLEPGEALYITPGRGTAHRPRA